MAAALPARFLQSVAAVLLTVPLGVADTPDSSPAAPQPASPGHLITDYAPGGLTIIEPTAGPSLEPLQAVNLTASTSANGLVVPAGCECPTGGRCGTPCPACRQARFHGWSVFADVISRDPAFAAGTVTLTDSDNNAGAGPRIAFGYEGRQGGGVEFRFSGVKFDELGIVSADGAFQGLSPVPSEMTTFQFDTDFYQRLWIGETSLVVSAGLRSAELGFQIGSSDEDVVDAFGLGGGLALNRPLHRTEFSSLAWIAHGKFSVLGGDIESPEDTRYTDGTLSILEAGLGLECRNRCGSGDFVTRGLLEWQHWESNMITPVAFAGASFGVGYQW